MFNNDSMNYYSTSTLKSALLKSYAWMAIALFITAIVSYGLYATNALMILLSAMPFLFMLFVIAPFILSIAFGVSMARSTSSTGMKVMLVLYAICMGVSLTSIGYVYDVATIGTAFLVSAVYFISLAVIGTTSKKDFTSFGSLCMIGLFVLIITQCFMMLFRVSMDVRLLSILTLLIFTGITVWDVQRMNRLLIQSDGSVVAQDKIAIFMALQLYLDFLNIFLRILQLIGMGNRNNKQMYSGNQIIQGTGAIQALSYRSLNLFLMIKRISVMVIKLRSFFVMFIVQHHYNILFV